MINWLIELFFPRQVGGALRSREWPRVRKEHLAKHPRCMVCVTDKDCDVHHILPFHNHPQLELEPSNLITLCTPHHLLFGHLMNYRSFNKDVVSDTTAWRTKILNRP